jgi:hypothetical protein
MLADERTASYEGGLTAADTSGSRDSGYAVGYG